MSHDPTARAWPALAYADWTDTCETLRRWTQVVGKIRMAFTPPVNHWWHVTLAPTARGLGTGAIAHPRGAFSIDFDLIDHRLVILVADGRARVVRLRPRTVADFHRRVLAALAELGIEARISPTPQETADAIPLDRDEVHRAYDPAAASRFSRALASAAAAMARFRGGFIGKSSPVHFFWGSFDLALTRFSGRRAPTHPGGVPNLADAVVREAYSHEVHSVGFWPGGGGYDDAAFYAYAYPAPAGFATAAVAPDAAAWHPGLGEFILPYAAVRAARDPFADLQAFFDSTYRAAADLAGWDRAGLERPEPVAAR